MIDMNKQMVLSNMKYVWLSLKIKVFVTTNMSAKQVILNWPDMKEPKIGAKCKTFVTVSLLFLEINIVYRCACV